MRRRYVWILGLAVTLALILIPIAILFPKADPPRDNPTAALPVRKPSTDHQPLLPGPYASGEEVTRVCLECHAEQADEVMQSVHWTWESKPYQIPGHDEPVTIGKKNSLNNFCIGIQSNWAGCTSCHAGYGWEDADFNFGDSEKVDCLVCHDNTGTYLKGDAGLPVEGVDLAYVAQSVSWPTRENCGSCHFAGGGGNAVKHGDLDQHLIYPTEDLDVHMGGLDMLCTDCHQTEDHQVRGRAISVSFDLENQAYCTDCHSQAPHADDRLNTHLASVACQTCHVPAGGAGDPTKMIWDWSTAGQDRPEDEHEYLKIKGSFFYEGDFTPEYHWYNGIADRYILGDTFDPSQPLNMNPLAGDINDPDARIFPFKVHRARQPYDMQYHYLLQPKTFGEGGYWTEFDWDQALRLGSEAVGLPYSGEYGFADTEMYWPLTHTVKPAGQALLCADCHSPVGRLDWQALGYPGDPLEWGVRSPAAPGETAQVTP